MASHRPYRPSLGLQCAVDELRDNSGTLYDPQVVSVFLRLVEEGVALHVDLRWLEAGRLPRMKRSATLKA